MLSVPLSGAGFQQFTLTVSTAGTGLGTVTSSPAGISCGVNCAEIYDAGTTLALTATPSPGSKFSGWTGDDTGTEATTTLTMDGDKTLTATFNLSKQLTVTRPNGGEIWTVGKSQAISWTYSGNPGAYVRIELLKGTQVYATIASRAFIGRNGKGSYNWRVPFIIPPGNDYRIRITSKSDSSITDKSDSPFTITRATSFDGQGLFRIVQYGDKFQLSSWTGEFVRPSLKGGVLQP